MNRTRKNKYLLWIGMILTCLAVLESIFLFKQQSFASWIEEEDGIKYENEDGNYEKGFSEIDGERYYFNGDGYLQTGKFYVKKEKAYYYANKKGVIQTGMIKNKKVFYIADENGKIQTGFVEYENNRYYFNDKAELVTGWFQADDNWYYADENGIILTGFITIDGYRYYLNNDGTRVSDAVMEIEGTTYVFNSDGSVDENATAMYPVFRYLSEQRTQFGNLGKIEMNSKVQSCAILRAADLKNGYGDVQTGTVENLLKNRGIKCSGGFEFSYGGIEGYSVEQLLTDIKRDINLSEILQDASIKEVGLGVYQEGNIFYYDIIFICNE